MNKYTVSLYKHSLDWINIRWKSASSKGKRTLESTNIGWLLVKTNASDEIRNVRDMANKCLVLSVVDGNKFSTKSYSGVW